MRRDGFRRQKTTCCIVPVAGSGFVHIRRFPGSDRPARDPHFSDGFLPARPVFLTFRPAARAAVFILRRRCGLRNGMSEPASTKSYPHSPQVCPQPLSRCGARDSMVFTRVFNAAPPQPDPFPRVGFGLDITTYNPTGSARWGLTGPGGPRPCSRRRSGCCRRACRQGTRSSPGSRS
jgi:hypothetical protein